MKLYWCLPLVLLSARLAVAADVPRMLYRIETVAGSANIGDGGAAVLAQIGNIQGVAADRWGNLYLSDTDNHRVRKVTAGGVVSTLAGTGSAGFSGDGGPAAGAQLNLPYGLAVDLAGYVYIADLGNQRVRRVGPDGTIATIAGTGVKAASGDGGPAVQASLMTPRNVAVDAAGNLYLSEFEGHRIRKVTPDGRIFTVAGTGLAGFRGDGGAATSAQIGFPAGLAVDRGGVLYFADSQNQRVRRILPGGTIATVLGGDPGTALLTPLSVAVDTAGTLYVADSSDTVRAWSVAGAWTTVAGTGASGFSGDGGPAAAAALTAPRDLASDLSGNLYIADGVRVRKVDGWGLIQTVAGDGYLHFVGDGLAATQAELSLPSAVALDGAGDLYIADTGTQRVRQVIPSGIIRTLAGTGVAGYDQDGVAAAGAPLNSPMGVAVDPTGAAVIADTYNHRIRSVGADGRIRTAAGTGKGGIGPEGQLPEQTPLRGPRGICLDRAGVLYIADTSNHRLLRTSPGAPVVTAAGNGSPGDGGDGGQARLAQLNQPGACALDSFGNLYIADTFNHRIRKVTPAGVISTLAGTGVEGFAGDEAAATLAVLDTPRGIAVDDNGDVYIADTGNNRIRLISPDGVIHTIAGSGPAGFSGDGDAALQAQLNAPAGLFLDGAGDLYLADTNNNRVRRLIPYAVIPPAPVTLPPVVSAVSAASLQPGSVAPGEIITLYGTGIGPQAGMAGTFDSAGLLANLLGGAEVRFDGVPAPLFYAQAGQINVQVPYTVAGAATTHVEVLYQKQAAGSLDLAVVASAPALFPAANPDGSANSETNPVARGSIVTLYATGEGLTDGANISGQVAQAPYARPRLPVSLAVAGAGAEILYAGAAPGFVGLLQVNARLPGSSVRAGAAAVQLTVGSAASPPITLWLQ